MSNERHIAPSCEMYKSNRQNSSGNFARVRAVLICWFNKRSPFSHPHPTPLETNSSPRVSKTIICFVRSLWLLLSYAYYAKSYARASLPKGGDVGRRIRKGVARDVMLSAIAQFEPKAPGRCRSVDTHEGGRRGGKSGVDAYCETGIITRYVTVHGKVHGGETRALRVRAGGWLLRWTSWEMRHRTSSGDTP
jgi:hypothetical protein